MVVESGVERIMVTSLSRILIIALTCAASLGMAQSKKEALRVIEIVTEGDASADSLQRPGPLMAQFAPERILSNVITLYQTVISSQDMPVCIFELSCSRYGQQTLTKHGLVKGVLMASDRFQRCNGIGRKLYPVNLTTGKFIDVP